MFKRLRQVKQIDNKRFFTNCPSYINKFGVYVWGDAIVFIPFHLIVFLFSLISLRFALLIWAIFFSIRSLGEIMFWFLQQFSDRSYRPDDFGFCKLDNNAIYILYQTLMTVQATVSIVAAIIIIKYWDFIPTTYIQLIEKAFK